VKKSLKAAVDGAERQNAGYRAVMRVPS